MAQSERSAGRLNEPCPSADRQAPGTGSVVHQAGRLAGQLQAALSRRATIDQAIGILISRGGGSAEQAAAALRDVSGAHDTDLGTVARQIVEEVSRQPHPGHRQP
jgi:ANTAR domain